MLFIYHGIFLGSFSAVVFQINMRFSPLTLCYQACGRVVSPVIAQLLPNVTPHVRSINYTGRKKNSDNILSLKISRMACYTLSNQLWGNIIASILLKFTSISFPIDFSSFKCLEVTRRLSCGSQLIINARFNENVEKTWTDKGQLQIMGEKEDTEIISDNE